MSAQGAELSLWLEESRAWAELHLQRLVPPEDAHPALLHRAMRYALFGGGKRLRPTLARTVCRALGGEDEKVERPAVALELVHTYSLVHDDLPCMDDDELRRGRPTCHVAFDEATAVLAGDGLLTLAFELCAHPELAYGAQHVSVLARAAGSYGMVGGQVLDLEPALPEEPPKEERLRDTHLRKTAALFGAACEMGALAAGAGDDARGGAREFGLALGLCFQAVDDLLDVTGDAATLGKTPGKDAALERTTLVAVLGVQGARERAEALGEEARAAARELGWGPQELPVRLIDFTLERRA